MNKSTAKTRMRYDEAEGMRVVTLIVLIAIIIVATAAGFVLFIPDSAKQQQVEHTGEIRITGPHTGFKILNVLGDRGNPNDAAGPTPRIEILEIKMGLLAGSPATNLSEMIIEISDGTRDVRLTFVDTTGGEYNVSASATQFAVQPLRDMDPVNTSTSYAIMTPGDVAKLFIDFNACGLNMYTGTQCSIKLIHKHGIPTLVTFYAPSVYVDRYVELY